MIDSILSRSVQGIQSSLSRANKHVDVITRPTSIDQPFSGGDTVGAMIGLKQEVRNVEANRKVIEVVSELDKSLLAIA